MLGPLCRKHQTRWMRGIRRRNDRYDEVAFLEAAPLANHHRSVSVEHDRKFAAAKQRAHEFRRLFITRDARPQRQHGLSFGNRSHAPVLESAQRDAAGFGFLDGDVIWKP